MEAVDCRYFDVKSQKQNYRSASLSPFPQIPVPHCRHPEHWEKRHKTVGCPEAEPYFDASIQKMRNKCPYGGPFKWVQQ